METVTLYSRMIVIHNINNISFCLKLWFDLLICKFSNLKLKLIILTEKRNSTLPPPVFSIYDCMSLLDIKGEHSEVLLIIYRKEKLIIQRKFRVRKT